MKRFTFCVVFFFSLFLATSIASAEKPSRDDMMTMFELSGASDILNTAMDQLVSAMEVDIKDNMPNLPDEAYFIVTDELKAGAKSIMGQLLAIQIDYYARYLTKQDVEELIEIYRSPVWKKNIAVGKKYIKEEYQTVLQQYVPKMSQEMLQRVQERLVKEGYIKNREAKV